jgi:hypothetical protein
MYNCSTISPPPVLKECVRSAPNVLAHIIKIEEKGRRSEVAATITELFRVVNPVVMEMPLKRAESQIEARKPIQSLIS